MIIYAACPYGYCVQRVVNGEIVEQYDAGNHRGCSQTYVDPSSPNAESESTLWQYAEQTAREWAGGEPIEPIERDDDLAESLSESLGSTN